RSATKRSRSRQAVQAGVHTSIVGRGGRPQVGGTAGRRTTGESRALSFPEGVMMLAISRRKHEAIVLNNNICVRVEAIDRDTVTLRLAACVQPQNHEAANQAQKLIGSFKGGIIQIDEKATIAVVDILHDRVRLAILCPKEYSVHRQEVYEAIHGPPASNCW